TAVGEVEIEARYTDRVVARAAVKDVGPATARKRIVTLAGNESLGCRCAGQTVGAARPGEDDAAGEATAVDDVAVTGIRSGVARAVTAVRTDDQIVEAITVHVAGGTHRKAGSIVGICPVNDEALCRRQCRQVNARSESYVCA